jgi:hypothetical protein
MERCQERVGDVGVNRQSDYRPTEDSDTDSSRSIKR